MVNEVDPFATSPDRKRKYQQGENEGALTEQLVYVNDDYVSEDDPDYLRMMTKKVHQPMTKKAANTKSKNMAQNNNNKPGRAKES